MLHRKKLYVKNILLVVLICFSYRVVCQTKDYNKIIDICNREIKKNGETDKKSNIYYKIRGDAYYYLGMPTLAISDYQISIKLGNNEFEPFLNLGICYYNLKKIDSSIIYLKQSIKRDRNNVSGKLYLSECYKIQNKYKEAFQILNELQNADPLNYNVKYNLGLLEMENKKYNSAIKLFKDCSDNSFSKQQSLLNISNCFIGQNLTDSAKLYIEKAKSLDSSNTFILIYEGHILVKLNQRARACEKYLEALKKGNNQALKYVEKLQCK